MKASIALTLISAAALLTATALTQARLAPIEQFANVQSITTSLDDTNINSGPAGAILGSSYFNAPQRPITSILVFPCHLPTNLFQKTRLVRACD
jgi:hypothetical protein